MEMNPFEVRSPETLSAQQVADLFIYSPEDFPKLTEQFHTFIHGPRGTGKSMMFRYIEPDVQYAHKKLLPKDLKYFAVLVPFRTNVSLPEFDRLRGYTHNVIAEHLMVSYILALVFNSLAKSALLYGEEMNLLGEMKTFEKFVSEQTLGDYQVCHHESSSKITQSIKRFFEVEFLKVQMYMRRLAILDNKEVLSYMGSTFSFMDTLVPICREISALSFTPSGPIYLLIDDADAVSVEIQKIINTWVSYRTSDTLCLKISTQTRYQTFRTTDDNFIETPHDYSEIIINTYFTSNKSIYREKVKKIVERRLALIGIDRKAEEFFPLNQQQEKEIDKIKEEIREKHANGEGSGAARVADDVTRYAVPIYMQRLASRRSSSTYSYAGFSSLVDISSGVIRYFLEPAARMFSYVKQTSGEPIDAIPVSVQNSILYEWSSEAIMGFEKLTIIKNKTTYGYKDVKTENPIMRLENLINSLGELFRRKLLSDDSERRLFSISLRGKPSEQLEEVLSLGIECDFLQLSTIGSKEISGRNRQYILHRRLAPYFKLDPSGYAGYLSVTADDLETACFSTNEFISKRFDNRRKSTPIFNGMNSLFDQRLEDGENHEDNS